MANTAKSPSIKEIEKFPQWERVALAIRCTKRLFPEMTSFSHISFHPIMVATTRRVPLQSFEAVLQLVKVGQRLSVLPQTTVCPLISHSLFLLILISRYKIVIYPDELPLSLNSY
jgi:hypothetical protein